MFKRRKAKREVRTIKDMMIALILDKTSYYSEYDLRCMSRESLHRIYNRYYA